MGAFPLLFWTMIRHYALMRKTSDVEQHITGSVPVSSFSLMNSSRIAHGCFSRHGGVSEGAFQSLNVSFHVEDETDNVHKNRKRIKETLDLDLLVSAKQVHGDKVYVVSEKPIVDVEVEEYDGLITNISGIGLMVQQADCQAVLLFDPVRMAVGIIHVGWRGSVANIIQKTVDGMSAAFNTNPRDLLAGISPSLGFCCAEFVNYKKELPQSFHAYQVKPNYFDFWAISRDQLISVGVKPDNIEASGVCTFCNTDYFSYRRDKTTGRCASVIGLK